jgi:hypothetical protein
MTGHDARAEASPGPEEARGRSVRTFADIRHNGSGPAGRWVIVAAVPETNAEIGGSASPSFHREKVREHTLGNSIDGARRARRGA